MISVILKVVTWPKSVISGILNLYDNTSTIKFLKTPEQPCKLTPWHNWVIQRLFIVDGFHTAMGTEYQVTKKFDAKVFWQTALCHLFEAGLHAHSWNFSSARKNKMLDEPLQMSMVSGQTKIEQEYFSVVKVSLI